METNRNLVLPFVIGAAVGAAVTYLIASGKTEELYGRIKDVITDAKDSVTGAGSDLVGKAKEAVNDFTGKGKDMANTVKEHYGEFANSSSKSKTATDGYSTK